MALSVTTITGTIAPNNSRDFEVPVGSTLVLTFPPNSQATVTENPLFVGETSTAGKLDQRITRVDGIPQTLTCGPYPTGANVTVEVSSRSSATTSWSQGNVGLVTASQLPGGGVALDAGGPVSVPQVIAQSAIPFVMQSSGTVGANGALSGLTAFNVAYGWCYCYFPAGAVFSGSVAGWYLTNLTGATIGTVYADTYTSGTPSIPASPTPIVAAGPGAYTQTTGIDIPGPSCIVPAGSMLENGALEWERATNNNNSAGQKIYNVYLGSQVLAGATQTTNPYAGGWGTVKNRGSQQRQHALNSQNGDVGNAGGQKYLTIDTTQSQVMAHSIRLNTATDYAVIESFAFSIRPKS